MFLPSTFIWFLSYPPNLCRLMLRGPSALLFPFPLSFAMRIIYFYTTLIRDFFTIIQLALPYRHFSYSSRSAIIIHSKPLSASSFIVILLPSFNLSAVMPPRPSNLNCYKTLSIWYAIYATSTSTLRCLLGHLLLYNFQRLLLGSLSPDYFHWQIPPRQSFSYS